MAWLYVGENYALAQLADVRHIGVLCDISRRRTERHCILQHHSSNSNTLFEWSVCSVGNT